MTRRASKLFPSLALAVSLSACGGSGTPTTPAAPAVNAVPAATTTAATNVGTTTATLNASVTPNGLATTVHFEWGTTTSYGNTTADQSIGSGTTTVGVTTGISNLPTIATLHYRVVATNSLGTTAGGDVAFVTSVFAPTVTTGATTFVSFAEGDVTGTVTPNGSPTTTYFEWGTTASYGNRKVAQSIAAGLQPVNVSANLVESDGLLAGTTYHYRLAATNLSGTTNGADMIFVTRAGIPPTVTTGVASNISANSATLQGSLFSSGMPVTGYFEWGTTTSYGNSTPVQQFGHPGGSFTDVLADLLGGTLYHFRAVGTNDAGTVRGFDSSFGTTPILVSTGVTSLQPTQATLNGSMQSPVGGYSIEFRWGVPPSYPNYASVRDPSTQILTQFPASSSAQSFSVDVTGLTPGTTYHYGIWATVQVPHDFATTVQSGEFTFTTPAAPALTEPAGRRRR